MVTTELATRDMGSIIEQVLMKGDLAQLTAEQRASYYTQTCESLGLNPLTRPFEYLKLSNKETLYVTRNGTDQLRTINGVSVTKLERERIDELYVVTAYATDKHGRSDSAIGAVNVKELQGENLANALMKAETKAKRRVTLSLCGLGWTDESEVDSIPTSRTIVVDHNTGEVLEERTERTDMVTDPNDKLWQLWERRKAEAKQIGALGYDLDSLTLPVHREVLIEEGKFLANLIAERKAVAA